MACFDAKQGRRLLEAARRDKDEQKFFGDISEALEKKELKPDDFSLRDIFEAFVDDGYEAVQSWSPRSGGTKSGVRLLEAGVDTSAFSNITGQIVYSAVLEAFNDPAFIGDALVTTINTQFSGEKIPGVARLGDDAESVGEGKPYPLAGVSEEWVETPETVKRGFIVPVTKEAIFFDRTGLVLNRAREVAYWLGVNKEKRVIDAATGQTNHYRRNGSSTIDTYGDNSGTHDWDNLQASNALVDWTDIENAELLFDGLLDPNTGEPILVTPNTLIIPTALKHTALRILNATEIRFGDGASATTQAISANPVAGQYSIVTNAYVKARTSSASTWFIGDPKRAFAYMQNWPITSVEAPPNSEMEFTHDIVFRSKVSERGTVAVLEPRAMVKCTA